MSGKAGLFIRERDSRASVSAAFAFEVFPTQIMSLASSALRAASGICEISAFAIMTCQLFSVRKWK